MVKLKLKKMIKLRKMSKRQFAKRLGMQYHSVFRFFNDNYNEDPKLSMLERWARALDCKIKDLFEDI